MKKKLLLVVAMLAMLICLLAVSVSAAEYTDENGIKYTTNSDGTATVANNTSFTGTEAIIKDKITVDGTEYTVTSVAGNAFDYLTTLTTIYFPPTITKITGWTFRGASNMEKIYIDFENLTYVGSQGFTTGTNSGGYNNVKEDIIIYATSEYGKETPTQTTVANFASITNIGQASFQGLNVQKIIIGENVTSFGIQSFRGSTVQELVFNCTNVTKIPDWSFNACANLETIDASNANFEAIGNNAFSATKKLASLTLDFSKIKRIEGSAFLEAGASASVPFVSSMDLSSLEYLGGSAFKKTKLTCAIVIPASCDIKSAEWTFEDVPISSVLLESESLTEIPKGFMSGASLNSIVVKSKNLTRVNDSAFGAQNVSPASITIDLSGVTYIGGAAFEFTANCQGGYSNSKTIWYDLEGRNLVNLKNVTSIGSEAFGTSNVGSAHIIWPDALTSISSQAFRKANLTEVYLNAAEGSSITAEYWAFNTNPIKLFVVGQGVTLSNQLEAQCTVVLLSETTITSADFIKVSGSKIYYTSIAGSNTTFAKAEMIPITAGTATSTACGIDCSVTLASDSSNVVISVPVHTWDEGTINESYCPVGSVVDFDCIYCVATRTEGEGTEHSHTIPVIIYENGFLMAGVKTLKCSNDGCTSVSDQTTEVSAIFVVNGYSAPEGEGKKSILFSYAINREALLEYNNCTDEKIVGYGLLAGSQSAVGTTEIFDGETVKENVKVAKVGFEDDSFDLVEIKITGLENTGSDGNPYADLPLYCCGYVLVKNGDSVDSYYIGEGKITETLETTVTYTSIANK